MSYAATSCSIWLLVDCFSQFDLLVELFHDTEKATSPTGQVPGTGGRTRLSIKPDKSREKTSKEHKKTVGCQVNIFPFSVFLSGHIATYFTRSKNDGTEVDQIQISDQITLKTYSVSW